MGTDRLSSVDELRTIYRPPSRGPIDKVVDRLDQHCADFLSRSPFFVLSSADDRGVCDGSPKGGRPGFVRALDERRLAWADLSGNNRLDSFQNVVRNPHVALLFMIPGLDETLRVNGRASLRTDADLLAEFTVDERQPRVVVVVDVDEAYIHCAKAYRRADLWSPDSWSDPADLPSAACIIKDHAEIDVNAELIEHALESDLEATLWKPGGETA